MGAGTGNVVSNIKYAGYSPAQIDDVYITHLHPDYIGGLVENNRAVFTGATVWVDKKEADYWLNDKNKAQETAVNQPFFAQAQQALAPYSKNGKVKFYSQPSLNNGVTVLSSPGHTPGHVFYKITRRNNSLFIVGDILHVGDVQFENPGVAIRFDTDPQKATETRLRDFHQFMLEGDAIAAAHLPFPGVGYILKGETG